MKKYVIFSAIVLICASGAHAQKRQLGKLKGKNPFQLTKVVVPKPQPQPEPEPQADTPVTLDAEAMSKLLGELRNKLPELVTVEDEAVAIFEKWDAREDLADNTKSRILELLFEDVKTVIADEDLRKAIWESWDPKPAENKL